MSATLEFCVIRKKKNPSLGKAKNQSTQLDTEHITKRHHFLKPIYRLRGHQKMDIPAKILTSTFLQSHDFLYNM